MQEDPAGIIGNADVSRTQRPTQTIGMLLGALCVLVILSINWVTWFLLGGAIVSLILFFVGIVVFFRYIRKVRRLRQDNISVPRSYIFLLILTLVAITSPISSFFLTRYFSLLGASTTTNTLSEFKMLAQACDIDEMRSYVNNDSHRDKDSGSYIEVRTKNANTLFYSSLQTEDLRQIMRSHAECPGYTNGSVWSAQEPQPRSWGY